jgi:hypothetical protein
MSATSIAEFLNSPYALIADVRMLNFFRYIGGAAAWVVLGLVLASFFVQNFWCRYLCPYGSFLGLASLLSPVRITRNASTCIDCAKREGMPLDIACRPASANPLRRVHRVFGVCSSLSSQRYADHQRPVWCTKAPCNSVLEYGRWSHAFVPGHSELCEGHRSVEHNFPTAGVSRTITKCESTVTSRFGPTVSAGKGRMMIQFARMQNQKKPTCRYTKIRDLIVLDFSADDSFQIQGGLKTGPKRDKNFHLPTSLSAVSEAPPQGRTGS